MAAEPNIAVITLDDVRAALRERVAARANDERIDALLREAAREQLGSASVDWLAAEYGYTRASFLNFLRKNDVPIVRLSRENVRVRFEHLRALELKNELKPQRRKKSLRAENGGES